MVDQLLEVTKITQKSGGITGFNPCCGGSVTGGYTECVFITLSILVVVDQLLEGLDKVSYEHVSILVVVDQLLEVNASVKAIDSSSTVSILVVVDQLLEFQSLLWWISYWRDMTNAAMVSILVVVDQLLEAFLNMGVVGPLKVSILVVVDQLLEAR